MSQVACGSDHGLSAISRDVRLAASSQTNFTANGVFEEVVAELRGQVRAVIECPHGNFVVAEQS